MGIRISERGVANRRTESTDASKPVSAQKLSGLRRDIIQPYRDRDYRSLRVLFPLFCKRTLSPFAFSMSSALEMAIHRSALAPWATWLPVNNMVFRLYGAEFPHAPVATWKRNFATRPSASDVCSRRLRRAPPLVGQNRSFGHRQGCQWPGSLGGAHRLSQKREGPIAHGSFYPSLKLTSNFPEEIAIGNSRTGGSPIPEDPKSGPINDAFPTQTQEWRGAVSPGPLVSNFIASDAHSFSLAHVRGAAQLCDDLILEYGYLNLATHDAREAKIPEQSYLVSQENAHLAPDA